MYTTIMEWSIVGWASFTMYHVEINDHSLVEAYHNQES